MLPLLLAALVSTTPLEASLPGVLLLLATRDHGQTGFGAAVLVTDDGRALTNLHVIAGASRILALPFAADKPAYAAHEGGLKRTLFEREADLLEVRVVRGDPALDLAVVEVRGLPTSVHPLRAANTEAHLGDAVVSIGHPEQNLWTISRGQISAIRPGLLQHDSPLNAGNSGGPLLSESGEIIGINTLIQSGTQGIAYARPILLADKLIRLATAPLVLAQASPEVAALSCARARELGSSQVEQCIDWDGIYELWRAQVNRTMTRAGNSFYARHRERFPQWLDRYGTRDVLIPKIKPLMSDFVTTDGAPTNMENFQRYLLDISRGGAAGASPSPSQQARMAKASSRARLALASMSTSSRQPAELDAHYLATYGLRTVKGANDLRALLKNGLRVKAVVQQQRDRAWVWLQGRNNDGSTYQFSALWRRRGAAWREAIIVAADRHDLPSTFPPPLPLWNLGLQAAFLATTQYLTVAMTCDDPNGVDDAEFLTRELEAAADTITRAVNAPRTPFSDSDLQSLPYLELFDGAPVD